MAADLSILASTIPPKPGLTKGDCAVYFEKEHYGNGVVKFETGAGIEKSIVVFLPPPGHDTVQKNDEVLTSKVDSVKNADGSTTLTFELYQKYNDTGGYIVRDEAAIQIASDGKLKSFRVETSMSSKLFLIFGGFRDFKDKRVLTCD